MASSLLNLETNLEKTELFQIPERRTVLWDHRSAGVCSKLQFSVHQKPRVNIKEKILQEAARYLETVREGIAINKFIGSLKCMKGSSSPSIVLMLKKLDDTAEYTTFDNLFVPVLISRKTKGDTHWDIAQYLEDLEALYEKCSNQPCMNMNDFFRFRINCSFMGIQCDLKIQLISLSSVFTVTPVNPLPLIASDLTDFLSKSKNDTLHSGFVTIDCEKQFILVPEDCLQLPSLPLVGIWVSGVSSLLHPMVWAACVRYISSSFYQQRLCLPPLPFLLVLYQRGEEYPEFYDCILNNGKMFPEYVLFEGLASTSLPKIPIYDSRSLCVELEEVEEKPQEFEMAIQQVEQHEIMPICTNIVSNTDDIPKPSPLPSDLKVIDMQPLISDISVLSDGNSFLQFSVPQPGRFHKEYRSVDQNGFGHVQTRNANHFQYPKTVDYITRKSSSVRHNIHSMASPVSSGASKLQNVRTDVPLEQHPVYLPSSNIPDESHQRDHPMNFSVGTNQHADDFFSPVIVNHKQNLNQCFADTKTYHVNNRTCASGAHPEGGQQTKKTLNSYANSASQRHCCCEKVVPVISQGAFSSEIRDQGHCCSESRSNAFCNQPTTYPKYLDCSRSCPERVVTAYENYSKYHYMCDPLKQQVFLSDECMDEQKNTPGIEQCYQVRSHFLEERLPKHFDPHGNDCLNPMVRNTAYNTPIIPEETVTQNKVNSYTPVSSVSDKPAAIKTAQFLSSVSDKPATLRTTQFQSSVRNNICITSTSTTNKVMPKKSCLKKPQNKDSASSNLKNKSSQPNKSSESENHITSAVNSVKQSTIKTLSRTIRQECKPVQAKKNNNKLLSKNEKQVLSKKREELSEKERNIDPVLDEKDPVDNSTKEKTIDALPIKSQDDVTTHCSSKAVASESSSTVAAANTISTAELTTELQNAEQVSTKEQDISASDNSKLKKTVLSVTNPKSFEMLPYDVIMNSLQEQDRKLAELTTQVLAALNCHQQNRFLCSPSNQPTNSDPKDSGEVWDDRIDGHDALSLKTSSTPKFSNGQSLPQINVSSVSRQDMQSNDFVLTEQVVTTVVKETKTCTVSTMTSFICPVQTDVMTPSTNSENAPRQVQNNPGNKDVIKNRSKIKKSELEPAKVPGKLSYEPFSANTKLLKKNPNAHHLSDSEIYRSQQRQERAHCEPLYQSKLNNNGFTKDIQSHSPETARAGKSDFACKDDNKNADTELIQDEVTADSKLYHPSIRTAFHNTVGAIDQMLQVNRLSLPNPPSECVDEQPNKRFSDSAKCDGEDFTKNTKAKSIKANKKTESRKSRSKKDLRRAKTREENKFSGDVATLNKNYRSEELNKNSFAADQHCDLSIYGLSSKNLTIATRQYMDKYGLHVSGNSHVLGNCSDQSDNGSSTSENHFTELSDYETDSDVSEFANKLKYNKCLLTNEI